MMSDTRTRDQNRLMWALLTDLSKQIEWPVDGRMQLISAEDWKHIVSAGLRHHQRVAAGIDGGFVILGQYTHKMSKAELSELTDLILAFGAEKGVRFSAPEYLDEMAR